MGRFGDFCVYLGVILCSVFHKISKLSATRAANMRTNTLTHTRPRINIVGKMCKKSFFGLDEKGKKWYDGSMDNNTEISKNIAKNLMFYRKEAGFTQAELAEKINYSDKSVSKWESGNGVPDVYGQLRYLHPRANSGAVRRNPQRFGGGRHARFADQGKAWVARRDYAACQRYRLAGSDLLVRIDTANKTWYGLVVYLPLCRRGERHCDYRVCMRLEVSGIKLFRRVRPNLDGNAVFAYYVKNHLSAFWR